MRKSVLAVALSLTACGPCAIVHDGEHERQSGDLCMQDRDCKGGARCYNGLCRAECQSSDDCDLLHESCVSGLCLSGIALDSCGDGVVDAQEQCDDGNAAAEDGCTRACALESGFVCDGQPSVCVNTCPLGTFFSLDHNRCVFDCSRADRDGVDAFCGQGATCTEATSVTQIDDPCECGLFWSGSPCNTCRVYVDLSGYVSSPGDGHGWISPFINLQAGIDAASDAIDPSRGERCEVWVTSSKQSAFLSGAASGPITLAEGVFVVGGFHGGDQSRAARVAGETTSIRGMGVTSDHLVTAARNSGLERVTVHFGSGTRGAGLYAVLADGLVLTDVSFIDNAATDEGGAIYAVDSDITCSGCRFVGNAAARGAGIYVEASTLTLTASLFIGNIASASGGGLFATSSTVEATSVAIVGNRAAQSGGGALIELGSLELNHATLSKNHAVVTGGALWHQTSGTSELVNSIVWGNTAGAQPAIGAGTAALASDVSTSILQGGVAGCAPVCGDGGGVSAMGPAFRAVTGLPQTRQWANVNDSSLDGDYFTDFNGPTTVSDTMTGLFLAPDTTSDLLLPIGAVLYGRLFRIYDGYFASYGQAGDTYDVLDFHLDAASPARDAGAASAADRDIEGNTRKCAANTPGCPDLGAYELQP